MSKWCILNISVTHLPSYTIAPFTSYNNSQEVKKKKKNYRVNSSQHCQARIWHTRRSKAVKIITRKQVKLQLKELESTSRKLQLSKSEKYHLF